MIRRLYDWLMRLAAHPRSLWAMAGVSFAESSFFPIPPDAMLVPMVLARPERAWVLAGVCTAASVVGGLFGYAIGYFLYETLGQFLISIYGYEDKFDAFRAAYNEWGLWIILIKGMTPIPYKLVTIASGLTQFDLVVFFLASVATRGVRFFLVAALLRQFGPPIREFVERYLTAVTTAFLVLVIGGIVAARYVI
ncbi:MAG: DedA family protein [Rhodospirillales bacterium]|nr:DedA family protein [Rhodospirillales bacterium]